MIASGSHRTWSPITPGFNLVFPYVTLLISRLEQDYLSRRIVGLARLDHDGGSALYRIEYWGEGHPGERFRLLEGLGDPRSYLRSDLELPLVLQPPPTTDS